MDQLHFSSLIKMLLSNSQILAASSSKWHPALLDASFSTPGFVLSNIVFCDLDFFSKSNSTLFYIPPVFWRSLVYWLSAVNFISLKNCKKHNCFSFDLVWRSQTSTLRTFTSGYGLICNTIEALFCLKRTANATDTTFLQSLGIPFPGSVLDHWSLPKMEW